MKKKTFIVQLLDSKKPSRTSFTQVEDALFYSNDTDAYLVFLPHEQEGFEFNEATVALYNTNDESLVERPAVIETFEGRKSVVLKMTEDILAHWGRWQAQVVFKQGNKINTSVVVRFDTLRYMLDQRPPTLRDVIKLDELYSQLVTVMDEIAGKDVISAPEIILARDGENTLGERLDKEHNEVTTQLAQKANEFDVRKKSDAIGLNDMDSEMLAAIQNKDGETTFNLLSTPREKSVTLETLADDVNVTHVGETSNPKVVAWIDTSDHRIPKDNRLAYLKGIGSNTEWTDNDFVLTLNNFDDAFANNTLTFPGNIIQYGTGTLSIGTEMTYVFDITPNLIDAGTRRLFSVSGLEIATSLNGGLITTPSGGGVSNGSVVSGNRYVIVMVVDGQTTKFYLNGNLINERTVDVGTPLPTGSQTFTIGNANGSKIIERQYQGDVHNILFFNRTLSNVEIKALADGLLKPNEIKPQLKYREKTTDAFEVLPIGGSASDISYQDTNVALTLNDYATRISTLESGGLLKKKIMHMSVDDTIILFRELNESSYTSAFEHPTLSFFKNMYDMYGATVSFYCFYTDSATDIPETFNMSEMTDRFKMEFEENSHWLKFGFHAYSTINSYSNGRNAREHYDMLISELIRVCGEKSLDKVVRTGFYAAPLSSVKDFKEADYGIIGLLSAEDARNSYYHTDAQRDFLQVNDELFDELNNVYFASTDLRLENSSFTTALAIKNELERRMTDPLFENRMDKLIIFTHEQQFTNPVIFEKIETCWQFAQENGYMPDFPMYHINTRATI